MVKPCSLWSWGGILDKTQWVVLDSVHWDSSRIGSIAIEEFPTEIDTLFFRPTFNKELALKGIR